MTELSKVGKQNDGEKKKEKKKKETGRKYLTTISSQSICGLVLIVHAAN
jgi:hypothetical protein